MIISKSKFFLKFYIYKLSSIILSKKYIIVPKKINTPSFINYRKCVSPFICQYILSSNTSK